MLAEKKSCGGNVNDRFDVNTEKNLLVEFSEFVK